MCPKHSPLFLPETWQLGNHSWSNTSIRASHLNTLLQQILAQGSSRATSDDFRRGTYPKFCSHVSSHSWTATLSTAGSDEHLEDVKALQHIQRESQETHLPSETTDIPTHWPLLTAAVSWCETLSVMNPLSVKLTIYLHWWYSIHLITVYQRGIAKTTTSTMMMTTTTTTTMITMITPSLCVSRKTTST